MIKSPEMATAHYFKQLKFRADAQEIRQTGHCDRRKLLGFLEEGAMGTDALRCRQCLEPLLSKTS
jgi:hypothetical protein